MQHFANFGFEQALGQAKNLGKQGLNYLDKHTVRSTAGIGAAAGALKGSGVFESEEERANTSGLGRAGKILGNAALGGTLGTGIGTISKKAEQLGNETFKKYGRKPSSATQLELPI